MSWISYAIAAAITGVVFLIFLQGRTELPLEPKRHHGTVSYVIDGDTLILSASDRRLRLWGVDAPEKDETGFVEARNALIDLVDGQQISWIEIDIDRYGRSVARVFLPDGREANRLVIERGAAREYCRYSKGFYGRC